jgi:hypothetical protein
MRPRQNAWNAGLRRIAVLACCSLMVLMVLIISGCKKSSQSAAPAATPEDPETHALHAIGDKAATAIVAKDINTLLQYDHDPEDVASLNNKSGDLYCYLFDSTCIPEGKTRAVYDVITTARQLGIDPSVADVEGRHYGLLMFYDKTRISSSELYSPDFLCSDKALKQTASWHFILENGKWTTTTLFDYKTERPCKH